MAQLMPLPLTVSCFSKIQFGFAFPVPAHLGSPGKRAVERVCVCVFTEFAFTVQVEHKEIVYKFIKYDKIMTSLDD